MRGFRNNQHPQAVMIFQKFPHCHPELVSGSGFDPLGGRLFAAISGSLYLSVQRFLSARSRTGPLRNDGACTEILTLRPGRQVRQILDCSDSFHWEMFKKTFAFPDILYVPFLSISNPNAVSLSIVE